MIKWGTICMVLVVARGDFPGLACPVHINDPLVAAAAELQGDVLFLRHKPPVDENVDTGEHFLRSLAVGVRTGSQQLLQLIAGVAPDVFLRIFFPDAAQHGQQCPLVFRFKGVSAQERQTAHIGLIQLGIDLLLRFLRKGPAVAEVPGFRLEAILTVVAAAGDEHLYHQEKRRFILNRIEIKEQGLFPCLRHAVFSQVIKHF